ncbi:MAG: polysaccharide biosynthesis/export family protein [Maricaulaceae bacterium]
MQNLLKTLKIATFMGVSGLVLGGCQGANHPFSNQKTNHFNPYINQTGHYSRSKSPHISPRSATGNRYNQTNTRYTPPKKYKNLGAQLRGEKHLAYQVRAPHAGPGQFQQWVNYEPEYRLYPGDQLDVIVQSAPELSNTLTVGPDGRVIMPMLKPIMAAGRTVTHVQSELRAGLAKQLRDPTIAVTPRAYAPQQIFIGGQVQAPGTYTLPGPIGAIEAIFMAGGFGQGARTTKVAVLRRAPNGSMMMRPINIQNGLRNIREYNDNMQLRRGDIIFVPKTNLAEAGAFVQAVRQTLPVDFNVSYTLGNFGDGGGDGVAPAVTTPIIP